MVWKSYEPPSDRPYRNSETNMNPLVTDNPPSGFVSELEDRIYEFNVAATGISDGRLLAIPVKDSHGKLIAGLSGHSWGGTCEIKLLWVAENERGRGLGARLLQTAETEARSRGCNQIVLSTHSFQAPGFYAKFGFVEVGRVHNYPRAHDSILLKKQLTGN